ncbi:hypothetical protein LEP1GSC061_1001 [Leptospira wolffii serovar Khorat str. Khorat-H2]|nr:hypothetical protein LEP1GSC061_1001 [Leptospira wolffii serovar Khorat str. Khorat-H2]
MEKSTMRKKILIFGKKVAKDYSIENIRLDIHWMVKVSRLV